MEGGKDGPGGGGGGGGGGKASQNLEGQVNFKEHNE